MQVTVTIPEGEVGKTIAEIFQNLPIDKKEELAEKIMTQWLQEPYDVEWKAHMAIEIAKVRTEGCKGSYGEKLKPEYWNKMTDDQIMRDYSFYEQQSVKNFQSSRAIMIKEIANATISHYKSLVEKKVIEDPQLEETRKAVFKTVEERFPEVILAVCVKNLSENTFELQAQLNEAHNRIGSLNTAVSTLCQHLGVSIPNMG